MFVACRVCTSKPTVDITLTNVHTHGHSYGEWFTLCIGRECNQQLTCAMAQVCQRGCSSSGLAPAESPAPLVTEVITDISVSVKGIDG